MFGTVLRVVPRAKQDFGIVPASYTSNFLRLARHVDVSALRELTMIARLHSGTLLNNSIVVYVGIEPDAPSREDPAMDFLFNGQAIQFTASSPVPSVQVLSVATPFGEFVNVVFQIQTTTSASWCQPVLSIDLVGKAL